MRIKTSFSGKPLQTTVFFYQVCKAPKLGRCWGWLATLPCSASPHEWVALPPATSLACGCPTGPAWECGRIFPITQPRVCTGGGLTLMAFTPPVDLSVKETRRPLVLGATPSSTRFRGQARGPAALKKLAPGSGAARRPEPGRNAAAGAAAKTPAGSHRERQDSGTVAPASARCGLKTGSCPRGSQRSSCCTASAAPL